jgi:hypothetical protein
MGGRKFNLDLLGTVSGLPVPDLLAAMEDLEHRGILRAASPAGQAAAAISHTT